MTAYLDGVFFGEGSHGDMTEFTNHPSDIGIGFVNQSTQFHDEEFNGDGHHLAGLIRDVRVWNTARTVDQILAEKDRTLDGDEPGLVANWLLDEGSGSTAFDGVSGFDAASRRSFWREMRTLKP